MSPQLVEKRLREMVFPPTSAGGSILGDRGYVWHLCTGGMLCIPGTTTMEGFPPQEHALLLQEQTNSGVRGQEPLSSGSAIMELRRLSGLTWDQLARLFGVTPRSLHFWASGKPPTPANEERLNRLLVTMRKLDRGSARENRSLLLSVRKDGLIPFDLLVAGQYEQVLALLGSRRTSVRSKSSPLSAEARRARQPLPPEELVGALPDRPHKDTGIVRVPRVARRRE
jgi:DNA-binding transcriptional regulator YiaG